MNAPPLSRFLFTLLVGVVVSGSALANGMKSSFVEQPASQRGFQENKGQMSDQFGKQRTDIQFTYSNGPFRMHLLRAALSYELVRMEPGSRESRSPIDEREAPMPATPATVRVHRVDVSFAGGNPMPRLEAGSALSGYENFYLAHLPESGATFVRSYETIRYRDVYEGTDLLLYTPAVEDAQRFPVKYDFILRPGADPTAIRIRYDGALSLRINAAGELEIETGLGTLREQAPRCWTEATGGARLMVNARYRLDGIEVSFDLDEYSPLSTLVIDPGLVWATYYGGSSPDLFKDVASDAGGFVYACGRIAASGMATTGTHQSTYSGYVDAILVKFSASGSRVWATYYGGAGWDDGEGVAIAGNGDVVLCGRTESSTAIATIGAAQTMYGSEEDGFIARFDGSGVRVFGTYIGGTGRDWLTDVSVQGTSSIFFVGSTESTNTGLVTSGCHQATLGGDFDALVGRLMFNGQTKAWCTYLGGSSTEYGGSCRTDANGNVVMVGSTGSSSGISTAGAHQTAFGGGTSDAMIQRFGISGSRIWGTYLGGSMGDGLSGVELDASGNIYASGSSTSANGVATSGAWKSSNPANEAVGLITKFSSGGVRSWGTYYGAHSTGLSSIAVTANGLYLSGSTTSGTDIATAGAFQPELRGAKDAILLVLTLAGVPSWCTYYGGTVADEGYGVAVIPVGSAAGDVAIGLNCLSADLVVKNAFQGATGGGTSDGAIAVFRDVTITTGTITPLAFCPGQSVSVPFVKAGTFISGNAWRAELSDATGSFANPTLLGSLNTTTSGTINGTVPASTPHGSGYRIRVASTNPLAYGIANTSDITIHQSNPKALTWTGAVSTIWSTVGNWDNPCAVPTDSDAVIIPPGVPPPRDIPGMVLSKLTLNNRGGTELAGDVLIMDSLILALGIIKLDKENMTIAPGGVVRGGSDSALLQTNSAGECRRKGIVSVGHGTYTHFPVGTDSGQYTPVHLRNTGTLDEFRVRVSPGVRTMGSTGTNITTHVVNRTWSVTEAVNGGSSVSLEFFWKSKHESSTFNRAISFVSRHNGSIWSPVTGAAPASGTDPYSRSISNSSLLGFFAIGDTLSVIPVELVSFTAKNAGPDVLLAWETAWERNSAGFDIERASADGQFSAVGRIQAHGETGGAYQFIDTAVPTGTWYYRLRQIDTDGSMNISSVVTVLRENAEPSDGFTISPNPSRGPLVVHSAGPLHGTIIVRDLLGRIVHEERGEAGGIRHLELSHLPSGQYVIEAATTTMPLRAIVRIVR